MKITFCAYDQPDSIGGPITWLIDLLPALKDKGFNVSCLIFFHVGNTGPIYHNLIKNNISVYTSPFLSTTEENIHWILTCLRKDPPDIFVPNLVIPAYYAAAWTKNAGIITVGVSHSDDPFYHAIQNEFVDGLDFFRLDAIVCVSNELEKQLTTSKYADQILIRRIPYGVNVSHKNKAQYNSKVLRVVYVGRLTEEQKRISEVAKAFCNMIVQIPNIEAVFYGDGPDRKNVEAILEKNGKDLPITLAGAYSAENIQGELLHAQVIVLLSDFEGLPISILEAMACGVVPVCLEMKSGISEQIQHGVTGFVVKNRDEDFIEIIKILSENQSIWENVSLNAKKFIANNFLLEASHDEWFDFLSNLPVRKIRNIEIPRTINLPKLNKNLARADRRAPNRYELLLLKTKSMLIKLRIKLGYIKLRLSKRIDL
jgi:colanic acid/amylovoran biosynthesis glycosyltransferase